MKEWNNTIQPLSRKHHIINLKSSLMINYVLICITLNFTIWKLNLTILDFIPIPGSYDSQHESGTRFFDSRIQEWYQKIHLFHSFNSHISLGLTFLSHFIYDLSRRIKKIDLLITFFWIKKVRPGLMLEIIWIKNRNEIKNHKMYYSNCMVHLPLSNFYN